MENRFKDSRGRDWTVIIDGYVLSRARSHGKIDLSTVVNQAMHGGTPDPALLLELCFYGCEHHSRIASGKVDKEEFLRGLKGEIMQPALEASAAALMDCFGVKLEEEEEEEEGSGPNGKSVSGNGASTTGSGSQPSPASIPGDATS